ncbi:hypothetical protein SBA6_470042 [Candidatus Sulfopaludibacter sp. SbA6]|nr:hypothetical protein SBA6_470042 [Candidatus Sulfopaludibacter sp. SbA6]
MNPILVRRGELIHLPKRGLAHLAVSVTCKSELFSDTGLSQHRVGGVPGQDFWSTGKRRCVIGLYQISWSPLPGRSK